MTESVPGAPAPNGSAAAPAGLDRRLLFLAFFFAVFLYLLYMLLRILSPFLSPLLGAVMLVLIFHPLHLVILRRVGTPGVAASLTSGVVLIAIVVPVLVLLWLLIREAADVAPVVRQWVGEQSGLDSTRIADMLPAPLRGVWDRAVTFVDSWQIDVRAMALKAAREFGNAMTSLGAATVTAFFSLVLNVCVLVLAMFFFFRDGEHLVRFTVDLVPMAPEHKYAILSRMARTLIAIIRGGFITAMAQGLLTGIGLAVAGVPFSVLLGFCAAVLAVVPFVGAGLVWMPAAVYLLIDGHTVAAAGLVAWGALVVGLVDNFLRPYVVGEQAGLPILLLLLGILGGLKVYGVIGALVSPLIIALLLAFIDIYREQFVTVSPDPVPGEAPGPSPGPSRDPPPATAP